MIPKSLFTSLANVADNAVNSVMATGATIAGQSPPAGEVGFVAAVVLGGVPLIAANWRGLLKPHGLSVQVSGVFCHQVPRVSFTDGTGVPRTCELADLLVVIEDRTSAAVTQRIAVLVQAKMAGGGGGKTLGSGGDLVQLELLSFWPAFTLPSGYSPHSRNFATCKWSGTTTECGRYGLLDGVPIPAWRQQAPAPKMPAGGDELGTFIAGMATGQPGYGREATGTSDDWSFTVDELMRMTYAQTFTHAATLVGSHPRQVSALSFVGYGDGYLFEMQGLPPPPDGSERGDGESEGGISLVHVTILGDL